MPQRSGGAAVAASYDNEHAQIERRTGDLRQQSIYRLVRLIQDSDEGLARCKNISAGGVALQLTMPVKLHDVVTLAFSPSVSLEGEVVWVSDKECGIRFAKEIDCGELLRATAAEVRAEGARAPRLATDLPARARYDGRVSKVTVQDVSQKGVKLSHSGDLFPGLQVTVSLPGGQEKEGVVRWTSDRIAGVYLLDPFSVEELGSINSLSGK